MSKLERLQEIAANPDVRMFPSRHMKDYGDVMKALPGLLRVCDAYIEAEAELSFLKESGDWEWHRERAEGNLEEMLG